MAERKRLTDEKLKQSIDEAYSVFYNTGRNYKRGMLTDDEFRRFMHDTFIEHFCNFLRNNGLRTYFHSKNWQRFLEDYSLWSVKDTPGCVLGEPWLLDDNLDDSFDDKGLQKIIRSSRGYGVASVAFVNENEASDHDKSQFFRLMEVFHITPDYFEPLPQGIIEPDRHLTHTYHGGSAYVIGFHCVDDGGLIAETEPVGKTYTLKSGLGLKSVVTITEDRRKQDRAKMDYDDFYPLGEYLSEGTIEGYTAMERSFPKIVIRTDGEGKISRLGTIEGWHDDYPAFSQYPLWQEYFRWNNEQEKRRMQILSDFFDSFKA